ncbi:MAG: calcium-binding protein, partial [Alphaproteobacteria bacterium]|nr:calcium-binding protein [Alphaproteobacteria bacterium]
NSSNNVLAGGEGNDIIDGGSGSDTVSYAGLSAGVTINLSTGAVSGAGGSDTLISIENVLGTDHNDSFVGGGNASVLDGGGGSDSLSYSASLVAITGNLATGTVSRGGVSDSALNFENLTGSAFDDVLAGNGSANRLIGGSGNDNMSGGAGDDHLIGGAGNDILDGGSGNNIIDGGAGFDYLSFASAYASVSINVVTGSIYSLGAGNDTVSGVEGYIGSSYHDTFVSGAGDDAFDGGAGLDLVSY